MIDPKLFLHHAWWHCRFGSDSTFERTPDRGDLDAVILIKRILFREFGVGVSDNFDDWNYRRLRGKF